MADNRTQGGSPNAKAYDKFGDKRGAFPIFDKKSALAAIKLRGHAASKAERASVIKRAAKYAPDEAHQAYLLDKQNGDI